MALKLKTFVTSNGLMDFIVATTSKAKALAAWGVGQDLFKVGQAHETDDPDLVEAATAEPGTVIRRPATTQAAIRALKPAVVERRAPKPAPAARAAVAEAPARKPAPAAPAKPKGPSEADLR